ncbi:MAG: hypothetical protein LBM72_02395 [Mycoplasmataceae bacterium]|jgi:aspartyl/glutamyl-tRNA(Asn/Gln) amidotransferase C subunit|nr:hypothetical protein [Mycoplasmataceae bacterium]
MKISKNVFKKLSLSLYFELDDVQLDKLCVESENLLDQLERLDYINTDNVTPMYYPHDKTSSALREDKPEATKDPESYIKNAHEKHGKYVVVK